MHFCVAILILKMEENILGMLCFIISRKVKMQLKHKKICTMYGEGGVTDQKWFAKFHSEFFSLDNVVPLGRSVEVDSDKIRTFIENNQCNTMWEEGDILKVSKSSVESHQRPVFIQRK